MKSLTIILDAAHGEEVPGKRSPDGLFREYKWSRETISKLSVKLKELGYEVFESNPTDREIGLSKRADNANKISRKNKIFISIHSNAAGNGVKWMNATGFSVYTTKGNTNSDYVAEVLMNQFIGDFPELKTRIDMSDGDKDSEEDFTVIQKTNCPAVLIEWMFQDNKNDVNVLMNEKYNNKFVSSMVSAIEIINDKYNEK